MTVSSSFRTFIVDQLSRVVAHVRARSMFGGVGIYADQLFFALIADDTLYFKVDDSNRPDFERLGMRPFQPYGEGGEVMQYYQVPADFLEDLEALRPWAEKAIAVAAHKAKGSVVAKAATNKRLKLGARVDSKDMNHSVSARRSLGASR